MCKIKENKKRKELKTMKTLTADTPLSYTYDPARGRASYTFDGEHWMNHGEFCERMAKAILGYKPDKDSVASNKKCDIPELKASVKSRRCGLSDRKDRPSDPAEFLEKFWREDVAEQYIWVCDHGDTMNLYFMNEIEFRGFVEKFFRWDKHITNFRMNICDNTSESWLIANYTEAA